MAKHEVIQNIFDGGGALDVYDRKYLKYFTDDYTDRVSVNVFNALKTKDINVIEDCLKDISNTTTNFMMLIGLSCLIVERERLYEGTEYGISYLRYADHLFDEMNIPVSTLSEAKIIVENYIDHYRQLSKAGFKLARNAMKLRYLPEALENHQETEVYNRIVNDTFRGFREWAQRKNIARVHKPGPQTRVDVAIKGNKLLVKGKNILNFPKGLSDDIRSMVAGDLEKTFSIREGGNEPYIIETYGRGEQAAINNFLKQHRSKK
jgi:hypothetical protein